MPASFVLAVACAAFLTGAGCTTSEGDVHGLSHDGDITSEASACAISPGACTHGGTDGGLDGDLLDAPLDDGAVIDGAPFDAAGLPMCQVAPGGNLLTVRGPGTPPLAPPFNVHRVFAGWNPRSCSQLGIALSDSDTCAAGAQELDISFYASGPMMPGTSTYMLSSSASAAIGVSYLPPVIAGMPPPDWIGPCAMPGSMITFDSLSWPPMAGSNHVSGTLSNVTLYPCGSATMSPTWTIDGTFDVLIDTASSCP